MRGVMKTFAQFLRQREHAETTTDHDNGDGDRETTRQKMVLIAKVACHKYPRAVMSMLEKIAQNDSEIEAALEDLKRNMDDSSLSSERGLGDLGHGREDEVVPSSADNMGGGGEEGE